MTRRSYLPRQLGVLLMLASSTLSGQNLPMGFTSTSVATGLSSPTAMAFAPDGRLFVCEKSGTLRVVKNDILLAKPFLSVTVDVASERGLLGIACDPDFVTNQFVYIYYTATTPAIHNRIRRYTASGDTALAGSDSVLLDLDNLGAGNHNGGAIHFGSDGKLYAAVGENAVGTNAQSFNNLLGKILRINSDGSIPGDNPFLGSTVGKNKAIWAMGLRNPFTFAFQPGTSRMFINDVGEGSWEEINDGVAGSNYGWPTDEGIVSMTSFKNPMFAYSSSGPSECAITGGTFYNPDLAHFGGSYVGNYFFSDYCAGWIHLFHPADSTVTPFATSVGAPVDLKVSSNGSLYVVDISGGRVVKIQFPAGLPVQLSTFTGTLLGNGHIMLNWSTLSEVNNYGFYVQSRPGDGQSYTDIAGSFVPGHQTTNVPWQYSFADTAAGHGTWTYRLRQVGLDGSVQYSESVRPQAVNSVGPGGVIPAAFALAQNYPNPFNPGTSIRYSLPGKLFTSLAVYNSIGQQVAVLVNQDQEAGAYEVTFDSRDLASGVYFYRLKAGGYVETKKLLLLR